MLKGHTWEEQTPIYQLACLPEPLLILLLRVESSLACRALTCETPSELSTMLPIKSW